MSLGWVPMLTWRDSGGDRTLVLSPEAATMLRKGLQSLAQLANAVEVLAQTQLALELKEAKGGSTIQDAERPPGH